MFCMLNRIIFPGQDHFGTHFFKIIQSLIKNLPAAAFNFDAGVLYFVVGLVCHGADYFLLSGPSNGNSIMLNISRILEVARLP